jgi:hypothetical protein
MAVDKMHLLDLMLFLALVVWSVQCLSTHKYRFSRFHVTFMASMMSKGACEILLATFDG